MDRIWQWAWDRHGPRYSWAIYAVTFFIMLSVLLVWSLGIVAMEESRHYLEAGAVTVVAAVVLAYVNVLPGVGRSRLVERWAAGREVDRAKALDATYGWARRTVARSLVGMAVVAALLFVVVGAIAGGNRVATGAVRGLGRHVRNRLRLDRCAQPRGSNDAPSQGRHRR